MYEPARIESAIELTALVEAAWQRTPPLPADVVINRYFRERRFIGSKDRGFIAALVYFVIRNRGALMWTAERQGFYDARALVLTALVLDRKKSLPDLDKLFDGEKFSPERLTEPERRYAKNLSGASLLHPDMPDPVRYGYPAWLETELRASLGSEWKQELAALSEEAPVDLRANTLLATREQVMVALKEEGFVVEEGPLAPDCIRMKERAPVFASNTFKKGWFEMQDAGSQAVCYLLPVEPGQKVVDFCAGAGGKTLALSARMKNKGRIMAWDVSDSRLEQMAERLKRAKADNVQRHVIASETDPFIKRHKGTIDAVLIDAPCTGTGTWRRNPDLKWRMKETDLSEVVAIQAKILDSASRLVKKDGYLLYVTCSLLKSENEKQVERFIRDHPNFRVVLIKNLWDKSSPRSGRQGGLLRLTPHQDGTDGFFASLLQREE